MEKQQKFFDQMTVAERLAYASANRVRRTDRGNMLCHACGEKIDTSHTSMIAKYAGERVDYHVECGFALGHGHTGLVPAAFWPIWRRQEAR